MAVVDRKSFVRANASAGAATGVDWLAVTLLVALGTHYLHAAATGAILGAMTDFSLKRHWVFDREEIGRMHHEAAKYLAASGISLVLNLGTAYLLVGRLHLLRAIPGVIAASIIVGIVWNYPVHRFYVFPEEGEAA